MPCPRSKSVAGAFALAACAGCASLASPVLGQVVIAPGWGYPVFQDTFDGGSINQGAWEVANWAGSNNNELQYYHPNQVAVSGGSLRLRADRDPNWSFGREYNSGLVRTWQEWSHGRFEVRAKVPNGTGFWPAIWLLPRNASWPAGGEIDIMEARGDLPWRISSAVHWGWDVASHQYVSQAYESGANFQAGYHIYAAEWEPGTVRFYVDGVQHMTVYEPAVGIPWTPKSIVLNLAVGGNYSGNPDWTTPFPAWFDIDYVRVWQRQATPPPPVSLLVDAGFEDDNGAMNAWNRFGDSIGNVFSDWGTPLDGERSLKMYGQFSGSENYSGASQNVAIRGGQRFVASCEALTRSEDSIAGTANEALLKVEFYSEAGAAYGSPQFLGESEIVIADAGSPEDTWSRSELTGVAPNGAVEARVTLLFRQPASNPGGSVFVDSVAFATTSCNAADLAVPFNELTFADIAMFLSAFSFADPVADLAAPAGQLTFADISAFLAAYTAGCP
jgi:beta-glucanase (GH16 family)